MIKVPSLPITSKKQSNIVCKNSFLESKGMPKLKSSVCTHKISPLFIPS